jgi:DNA-directed RNA polymerase specialized sigma24 family protein
LGVACFRECFLVNVGIACSPRLNAHDSARARSLSLSASLHASLLHQTQRHLFSNDATQQLDQRGHHYQLFDLYVMKQWPVKKVAQTLGVNVGLVYLAKHRISALLKKELKELKRNIA